MQILILLTGVDPDILCFSTKCPVNANAVVLRPHVESQGSRIEELPLEANNDTH